MKEKMKIPPGTVDVLRRLADAGYEAYLVGGCVRDWLMGTPPHDYDITTSALPQEMKRIFKDAPLIETGLQHGTLTVLTPEGAVEVTTYRQDGAYTDHRHPNQVVFTRSLEADLARRDFTVNAMAMRADGRIVDPFGGQKDLKSGQIRCVGEAERRFEEDALRILRGLRFSARLGFAIEPATAAAMERKKGLLAGIAAERIFSELCGLWRGSSAGQVCRDGRTVLKEVLPEWNGHAEVLLRLPPRPEICMAALLAPAGSEAVERALTRLKAPGKFRRTVRMLVQEQNNLCLPDRNAVWQRCAALGYENFKLLVQLQRGVYPQKGNAYFKQLEDEATALIDAGACLHVRELAVNGRDAMALGYRGAAIGEALQRLLERVIAGQLLNERTELLEELKKKKPQCR